MLYSSDSVEHAFLLCHILFRVRSDLGTNTEPYQSTLDWICTSLQTQIRADLVNSDQWRWCPLCVCVLRVCPSSVPRTAWRRCKCGADLLVTDRQIDWLPIEYQASHEITPLCYAKVALSLTVSR